MKAHVAALTLILAVLCPAAENSPFYLPIRNNDLTTLKKLIDSPGPKARDGRGNSPLMYSAALGSLESMRLLLDAGADPNAANDFAATPLMWCAGDAAKVRLLLSKGAKVDARSKLGRTPLLIAAAYDGAIEAARLLIEKGADVDARDEGGTSVFPGERHLLGAAGEQEEFAPDEVNRSRPTRGHSERRRPELVCPKNPTFWDRRGSPAIGQFLLVACCSQEVAGSGIQSCSRRTRHICWQ